MSVGWDVKWCPVSRKTTPLARQRPFRWRVGSWGTPGKLQNFTNYYRLLMVAAVMWPKYCRYGVKHYIMNQPGISVGWDVKWCPVTRITTPFGIKRNICTCIFLKAYVERQTWSNNACTFPLKIIWLASVTRPCSLWYCKTNDSSVTSGKEHWGQDTISYVDT